MAFVAAVAFVAVVVAALAFAPIRPSKRYVRQNFTPSMTERVRRQELKTEVALSGAKVAVAELKTGR